MGWIITGNKYSFLRNQSEFPTDPIVEFTQSDTNPTIVALRSLLRSCLLLQESPHCKRRDKTDLSLALKPDKSYSPVYQPGSQYSLVRIWSLPLTKAKCRARVLTPSEVPCQSSTAAPNANYYSSSETHPNYLQELTGTDSANYSKSWSGASALLFQLDLFECSSRRSEAGP
jgi:hypothetical protein